MKTYIWKSFVEIFKNSVSILLYYFAFVTVQFSFSKSTIISAYDV